MPLSGAAIKLKREAAGIVGDELASAAGIARSQLTRIERGYIKPAPEYLEQLEATLDVLMRAKIVEIAAVMGRPITFGDRAERPAA